MEGSGFGSVQIISDPDPKGPKINGSFRSGTLLEVVGCLDFWAVMMYLPSNTKSMGTDSELKATMWMAAVCRDIYASSFKMFQMSTKLSKLTKLCSVLGPIY
jgi:hypothetical protein